MQIIESLSALLLNRWFLGYNLFMSVAQPWYAMRKCKHLKGTPELNEKYFAFARYDYPNWNLVSGAIINFLTLFPARFLLTLLLTCTVSFTCYVITFGASNENTLAPWRINLNFFITRPLLRVLMWGTGIAWISEERPEVDYRKYLGPDWKKTYEGAGIQVCNHSGWPDILTGLYCTKSAYVAKREVKNWFAVGSYARCIKCLFIERIASPEKHAETIKMMQDRQIQAEKGIMPPIIIYPEGITTNGTTLVQFKKGAFLSLRPVQPIVLNYWTAGPLTMAYDVLGILNHIHMLGFAIFATVKFKELPVFAPNDYFWKHHWKEGKEEKWQAFARAVREIMAEVGNFRTSEMKMKDKAEYKEKLKELVKPKDKCA